MNYYTQTQLCYSIVSGADFPAFKKKNLIFTRYCRDVIYCSKEIKQYIPNSVGSLREANKKQSFKRKAGERPTSHLMLILGYMKGSNGGKKIQICLVVCSDWGFPYTAKIIKIDLTTKRVYLYLIT